MFHRIICGGITALTLLTAAAQGDGTNCQDNRYLTDSLPRRWCYTPERSIEIPDGNDSWWHHFWKS